LHTAILLIRHAAHEHLGLILSGRMPGVPLSPAGAVQAARLAAHLADVSVSAIHSSPVQRARETAAAIALPHGLRAEIAEGLDEIDFGSWTGESFAHLQHQPEWIAWNSARGSASVPGGETMARAQARIVAYIEGLARHLRGGTVVLVSHCDMIRAAVAHYLGLALDRMLSFDIDPASISRLAVGDWGGRVVSVNESCE